MDSLDRKRLHSLAAWTVAFTWIYHGLVPKLLFSDADEAALLVRLGVSLDLIPFVTRVVGAAEVLFGLAVLAFANAVWPFRLTITLTTLATIGVAFTAPHYLATAFNPVTLNVLMISTAIIAILTRPPAEPSPQDT